MVLTSNKDINKDYMRLEQFKQQATKRFQDYDTLSEFKVERKLNEHIEETNFLARRSENIYNIDIDIFNYNYTTGEKSPCCGVEVETKGTIFTAYPKPPDNWNWFSFLARKIDNEKFNYYDVYLLCDNSFDKIYWTIFGHIRGNGKYFGEGDTKFVILDSTDDQVYRGYEKLAEYFLWLKEKSE